MYFVLFAFLPLFAPTASGANILGVFSVTSISHQIVYRTLMLELNKRGHNITIITPNPINDSSLKNYKEIDVSFYYDKYNKELVNDPKKLRYGLIIPEVFIWIFIKMSEDVCQAYFSSPQIQNFLQEKPNFDLVITEFGFNPCFYGFSKFSKYRQLGIFSFQTNPVVHSNFGNPIDASYIPDVNFQYLGKMNILQKVRVFIYQGFLWFIYWYVMNSETTIARKYLGEDLPHLVEIERNLSAMMVNTHFTMGFPRPNVPNMIEIGGPAFHLAKRKLKPLPKDIKDFLDDAPNGVIYFSLGTNVKTGNISIQEENIFIESFRRIKQKVLWKWENENLKVDLKNVKKEKWFPQIEVLAHPNVKAFVTQAGLQSVGEAIEFNVPMIVMPFFADQNHNARKMELEGAALYMDFDTLDVDKFTQALNEIVYNKKYKENIQRLSALVKDQPIPPLEKAVWWTEYVIRHNGAPHLRSAATTMPFYQYLMLDVLTVILLVLIIILHIIDYILSTLCNCLSKRHKKSKKD